MLEESRLVTALRECILETQESWRETGWPVILIGCTTDSEKLSNGILGCFKTHISIEVCAAVKVCIMHADILIVSQAPDEAARKRILIQSLSSHEVAPDVDVSALALNTAALLQGDLLALISEAASRSMKRCIERL